jgi:CysZ protein
VGDLALGIYDGLRGAGYLVSNPRLWGWVLLPAVIAAVILVAAVGWIVGLLSVPIAAVAAFVPGGWADNVLKAVAWIVLGIAGFSIFISVAALIAAPFNEMLSEAIEERVTGVKGPKFRIWRFVVDVAVGIAHAARRVAVYLVVMGGLLILGLVVPVVGTVIAGVLGFIATARFASYDAYDAVWARRRWRYRAKMAYLQEHRWRTLGMGAIVAAVLIVPGLNLIALSIGATAATLRMIEQDRARKPAAAV